VVKSKKKKNQKLQLYVLKRKNIQKKTHNLALDTISPIYTNAYTSINLTEALRTEKHSKERDVALIGKKTFIMAYITFNTARTKVKTYT
jgi:hypothetical protein